MKHLKFETWAALALLIVRPSSADAADSVPSDGAPTSGPARPTSVVSPGLSGSLPDRTMFLRAVVVSADIRERRTPGPVSLIVLGSLGVVAFGITTAVPPFYAGDAIALGTAGFVVGGGVVSALSDEDYRKPIANVTLLGGLGGLAIASASIPDRFTQESGSIAIAAGSFSSATLVAIGAAAHHRPVSRLRRDRDELETNVDGAPPSADEIRRIERDLRDMDPVIPDWITYAPLLLGGAVSCAPAVIHGFSDVAENGGAAIGAVVMLIGGVAMVHVSYYDAYRTAVHHAGLGDVALGPGPGNLGGISLSGRFY